jgi:hypothetical protein
MVPRGREGPLYGKTILRMFQSKKSFKNLFLNTTQPKRFKSTQKLLDLVQNQIAKAMVPGGGVLGYNFSQYCNSGEQCGPWAYTLCSENINPGSDFNHLELKNFFFSHNLNKTHRHLLKADPKIMKGDSPI